CLGQRSRTVEDEGKDVLRVAAAFDRFVSLAPQPFADRALYTAPESRDESVVGEGDAAAGERLHVGELESDARRGRADGADERANHQALVHPLLVRIGPDR